MNARYEYRDACLNILKQHPKWTTRKQAEWLWHEYVQFDDIDHAIKRLKYYKGQDGKHNSKAKKGKGQS
jgi:hypothetical protein